MIHRRRRDKPRAAVTRAYQITVVLSTKISVGGKKLRSHIFLGKKLRSHIFFGASQIFLRVVRYG